MCNFSEGNSLLILQLIANALAYLVLRLFSVLHAAASPISEDLNPEVLILLQISVDLECQVVFLVSEQYLQELVVSHETQLLVCDVPHLLTHEVADAQQLRGLVDIVVVDQVGGKESLPVCGRLH